ncbi:MAG: LysM peptidoglycan-binding domain-containing protein [Lacunisphaera sp.]|nr:LysM peptidoglycan-binding domain-containing protein [Lacunisphaera sp.]
MKILQIFGAVVAVHLLAFIFIFASPGCQSGPRNIPTPDATVPTGPTTPLVTYDSGAANLQPVDLITYSPASPSGHAVPTRPGSAAAVAITPAKPAADVAPVSTYTVTRGDSLWSIAQKNGLTVAELAKSNNLGVGATLQPGKKLIILGKVVAPKDLSAAAPAGKAPAAADKASATPARTNGETVKHTVQVGESLGVIARKYQVTVGELASQNNITDPSKVRAGQQLVIPGFKAVSGKGTTTATPAKSAAPEVTAPHFEIAAPPPGQDLDTGLKGAGTEVPTIKVEEPQTDQPPKK